MNNGEKWRRTMGVHQDTPETPADTSPAHEGGADERTQEGARECSSGAATEVVGTRQEQEHQWTKMSYRDAMMYRSPTGRLRCPSCNRWLRDGQERPQGGVVTPRATLSLTGKCVHCIDAAEAQP